MSLVSEDFFTARCINAFARRRNFWRFSRLLPPGLRRLSTICIVDLAQSAVPRSAPTPSSACLLHPHIPLDQPSHLALGITAGHHALDEVVVLLLGVTVLLGAERDHRQEVLDLRED